MSDLNNTMALCRETELGVGKRKKQYEVLESSH
jgi:hypothetical protein